MADADKRKDDAEDNPESTTEGGDGSTKTEATAAPAPDERDTEAGEATDGPSADETASDDTSADGTPADDGTPAEETSPGETSTDGTDGPAPRPSFAENRADDDGMAPLHPDEDAGAPRPETGDHSVTPADDGLSPKDDLPEAPAESAETTDTIAASGSAAPGTAPAVTQEKVIERRGGFFPMLLGGVVAAAAGFALSQYLGPNGWPFSNDGGAFEEETRAALSDSQTGLDALGSRIGEVETGLSEVDLSSIETSVADLVERTGTLGSEITALAARVDAMAGGEAGADTSLAALQAEIEGLQSGLGAIDGDAGTLAERVAAIEKAPLEDAVSPETVAAYERELADLQSRVEDQTSSFDQAQQERAAAMEQRFSEQQAAMEEAFASQQAQIEEQRAELQEMLDEARAAEADAERQAQLAQLRAAAADLLTAVRTGEPYADALDPLSGEVELPEALTAPAEDGVPTQAALIDGFPEAARAGLAAARSADTEGENGGNRIASFMARQLGARSVTPQEGSSPDAILSRAEAAVNAGDLQTALDEISALPEAAQDAMSDWTSQARTRAEAVAAADGLAQQLNQE